MNYQISYNSSNKKLTVRNAQEFPEEILKYANNVEILDMSVGEMTELSVSMGRFTKLRVLFLSDHKFTKVPVELASCASLEMLGMKSCRIREWPASALPTTIKAITLTDNELTTIPEDVGSRHPLLKKLMLTGNRLTALPDDIANCELELLRIADNRLEVFPSILKETRALKWFTDSGNPYIHKSVLNDEMEIIELKDLHLGEAIGRSSKNVVRRTQWRGQDVAVKLFGKGITTDGTPYSEVAANIAVRGLRGLVGTLALVSDKGRVIGLVMPMIDSNYSPVAQPPDLLSYTRDVYETGRYSTDFAKRCLLDIGTAILQLHRVCVMHGDIYGHNILADEQGNALLMDLGAATCYTGSTASIRFAIEARAFGVLCEELLSSSGQVIPAIDTLLISDGISDKESLEEALRLLAK